MCFRNSSASQHFFFVITGTRVITHGSIKGAVACTQDALCVFCIKDLPSLGEEYFLYRYVHVFNYVMHACTCASVCVHTCAEVLCENRQLDRDTLFIASKYKVPPWAAEYFLRKLSSPWDLSQMMQKKTFVRIIVCKHS